MEGTALQTLAWEWFPHKLKGWILLMTAKFWKPIGSSKLIRHPRWDFLAPVNSTGSPTIAVSVFFPSNAKIDPTTQQLIGETCSFRYARCICIVSKMYRKNTLVSSSISKWSNCDRKLKLSISFSMRLLWMPNELIWARISCDSYRFMY